MSFGYDIGCDTCMKSEACKDDKRRTGFFRDCLGYEPLRIKDISGFHKYF
ncbi:MAG: hypothetical protein II662_06560 [Bacteroidales bacterium]|nr:hypothetical protein [Bacteroidales bacterium]